MQFDNFAGSYNQHAFIQKDLIEWGIEFLDTIPLLNKTILELGAGTGLLTEKLINKNISSILATDRSLEMINVGKRKVPAAKWQEMDAWETVPEGFDTIFSSSLLQWAPNPAQVIANWARSLPTGGTVHALFFIDKTLRELRQLVSLENGIQWKTFEEWKSIFRKAGLTIYFSRELIKIYQFKSALDLLKILKNTGTTQKNFIEFNHLKKIIRHYDEQFNFNDKIYSTWNFCQIIGIKK